MAPTDFHEAHAEVIKLVQTFADNLEKFNARDYNETAVRNDFINKFFISLGWDVNHDYQTNPYEQEVKVERNVNVAARVKKADYAFFLKPNFGSERFFVEAKRPSAALDSPDNCFQTIRYAFSSSRAALSILTNFKELYVIDCRFRPDIATAVNHVHRKYQFSDFLDTEKFAEIYWLFGRTAVAGGSLEKYAGTLPKPKGKVKQRRLSGDNFQEIDDMFLAKLEEYREDLAKMFKRKNPNLTSEDLTEAVQRTLDRLVFIRFLEDKLIEPSTILDRFGDKPHAWAQFIAKCREFDKSYNGIIFKAHPLIDSPSFLVDDAAFLKICDDFADKYSPYHFNYIPIHILGSIYERFLGNVIVATAKRAAVEPKPEVRKAGGVFYTPQYIVNYIVENTVGKLLKSSPRSKGGVAAASADGVVVSLADSDLSMGKERTTPSAKRVHPSFSKEGSFVSPADVAEMRFADIACGSGSFLLGVYDYLLRWHTKYYNSPKGKKEAKKDGCITNDDGTFALSFEQKREILVNNIYGVDIDRQAYEVTQLSLFLKLLEDETTGTKQQFLTGHHQSMLPSLANNIVCGNALVDWDISSGDLLETIDADKERRLNPMSFTQKFPQIMRNGGFDAVVGNPPYISLQRGFVEESVFAYLHREFSTLERIADFFAVFSEQALRVLKPAGRFSYIVPATLLMNLSFTKLRKLFLEQTTIEKLVHLGDGVFEGAVVPTCIFVVSKKIPKGEQKIEIIQGDNNLYSANVSKKSIPQSLFLALENQVFNLDSSPEIELLSTKLRGRSLSASELVNVKEGVKTGNDAEFLSTAVFATNSKIVLKGRDVNRYSISPKLHLHYDIERLSRPQSCELFERAEKLLIRRVGAGLVAAYDKEKYFCVHTLYVAHKLADSPQYDLKYILGIINSRLTNFYYRKNFIRKGDTFPEVRIYSINALPVARIDFTNRVDKDLHDTIVRSVEQIMEAKQKLAAAVSEGLVEFWTNKVNNLEKSIDEAVYKLYDLTPDEIKLIESA